MLASDSPPRSTSYHSAPLSAPPSRPGGEISPLSAHPLTLWLTGTISGLFFLSFSHPLSGAMFLGLSWLGLTVRLWLPLIVPKSRAASLPKKRSCLLTLICHARHHRPLPALLMIKVISYLGGLSYILTTLHMAQLRSPFSQLSSEPASSKITPGPAHKPASGISPSLGLIRLSLSTDYALAGTSGSRPRLYRSFSCHDLRQRPRIREDKKTLWCQPLSGETTDHQAQGHPFSLRQRFLTTMKRLMNTSSLPAMTWVYSTLTGDSQVLDESYRSQLRLWGLGHLGAVSGFHLIMILAALRLFRSLGRYLRKHLHVFHSAPHRGYPLAWDVFEISSLIGWLYLVGFPASALRAFVCYLSVRALSSDLLRPWLPHGRLRWLILPGSGFLLLSPLEIFGLSSVLSWSAYLMLITLLSLFSHQVPSSSRLRAMVMFCAVQIGFFFLSLLLLGEASWLSLLGHILILPVLIIALKITALAQIIPAVVYLISASLTLAHSLNEALAGVISAIFATMSHITLWTYEFWPIMVINGELPNIAQITLKILCSGVAVITFWYAHLRTPKPCPR